MRWRLSFPDHIHDTAEETVLCPACRQAVPVVLLRSGARVYRLHPARVSAETGWRRASCPRSGTAVATPPASGEDGS